MTNHLICIPHKEKIKNLRTTTNREIQLWQELTLLRHIDENHQSISPLIDQGKTYFLDAWKSNWKSAGLLYYYSFLNLSKAFISSKGQVDLSQLESTSLYHGISADAQNVENILDFNIKIHPTSNRGTKNVFALFYESLTNNKWPFHEVKNFSLREIVEYCEDIGSELNMFHGIFPRMTTAQSIVCWDDNHMWVDLIFPKQSADVVREELHEIISEKLSIEALSEEDLDRWYKSNNLSYQALNNVSYFRVLKTEFNEKSGPELIIEIIGKLEQAVDGKILIHQINEVAYETVWKFIPPLEIHDERIIWHPLLSDYLFAFVLSTILRYHPHIFRNSDKNAFLAEAWCNQAPITALRHFVFGATYPRIRVN